MTLLGTRNNVNIFMLNVNDHELSLLISHISVLCMLYKLQVMDLQLILLFTSPVHLAHYSYDLPKFTYKWIMSLKLINPVWLRDNVLSGGVYEAIYGFWGWLNAEVEPKHLIIIRAIYCWNIPAIWTFLPSASKRNTFNKQH